MRRHLAFDAGARVRGGATDMIVLAGRVQHRPYRVRTRGSFRPTVGGRRDFEAGGSRMSDVAQAGARAGGVLAVTCISTLVVNANTSAVSILLPAISEDTGTSVNTLQWAVTGYSLVGAAVIVTSGSLGDVFGRKRIFQLACCCSSRRAC